ncbi:MAG: hypothetical protein MJZ17_00310 [Bacteroidales bacterium]|nr:hypothetical protein [Bacteroidales bacterium]
MKTTGIILIVFGAIALLGSLIGGSNPIGGLFFLFLGIFLVQRAKQKKEDAEKKRKWENIDDNH